MFGNNRFIRHTWMCLVALFSVSTPTWGGDEVKARDHFFESLIFGQIAGREASAAILRAPLKKPIPIKSDMPWEEQQNIRDAWFSQAAKVWFDPKGQEWKKQVNVSFLEANSDIRVGETLHIRTARGQTTAKVSQLDIDISNIEGMGGGPKFIAMARLDQQINGYEGEGIIASRRLSPCADPCGNRQVVPPKEMQDKISVAAHRACGLNPDPDGNVEIFEGHFSEANRTQFAVSVLTLSRAGDAYKKSIPYSSGMIPWGCTVVLDSDLTVIELLHKGKFEQVAPEAASDIDGDGRDEIWTVRSYEGDTPPINEIYYWRGQDQKPRFGRVYENEWLMKTSAAN